MPNGLYHQDRLCSNLWPEFDTCAHPTVKTPTPVLFFFFVLKSHTEPVAQSGAHASSCVSEDRSVLESPYVCADRSCSSSPIFSDSMICRSVVPSAASCMMTCLCFAHRRCGTKCHSLPVCCPEAAGKHCGEAFLRAAPQPSSASRALGRLSEALSLIKLSSEGGCGGMLGHIWCQVSFQKYSQAAG